MRITTWSSVPVACAVAGGLAGGVVAFRMPTVYASTATIRLAADPQGSPRRFRRDDLRMSVDGALAAAHGRPHATSVMLLHQSSTGDDAAGHLRGPAPQEQARRVTAGLTTAILAGPTTKARTAQIVEPPSLPTTPVAPAYATSVGTGGIAGLALGGVWSCSSGVAGHAAARPEHGRAMWSTRSLRQPLQQADDGPGRVARIVATRPTSGTSHAASIENLATGGDRGHHGRIDIVDADPAHPRRRRRSRRACVEPADAADHAVAEVPGDPVPPARQFEWLERPAEQLAVEAERALRIGAGELVPHHRSSRGTRHARHRTAAESASDPPPVRSRTSAPGPRCVRLRRFARHNGGTQPTRPLSRDISRRRLAYCKSCRGVWTAAQGPSDDHDKRRTTRPHTYRTGDSPPLAGIWQWVVGLMLLLGGGGLVWYYGIGSPRRCRRAAVRRLRRRPARRRRETAGPRGGAERRNIAVALKALGTVTPLNTVIVRSRLDGELVRVLLHRRPAGHRRAGAGRDRPASLSRSRWRRPRAPRAENEARLQQRPGRPRDASSRSFDAAADPEAAAHGAGSRWSSRSEGTLQSNDAQVNNAKLQLVVHAKIVAPIAGRLGLRQVDAGNLVRSGDANGIVVITQMRPISVLFTVPETELPAVLDACGAERARRSRRGTVPRRRTWPTGTLRTVDNQIDTTTGTIRLRAEFDNNDETPVPEPVREHRLRVSDAAERDGRAVGGDSARLVRHVRLRRQAGQHGHDPPDRPRPGQGERVAITEGLPPASRWCSRAWTTSRGRRSKSCPTGGVAARPRTGGPGRARAWRGARGRRPRRRGAGGDAAHEHLAAVHPSPGRHHADHAGDDAVRRDRLSAAAGVGVAAGRLPDHPRHDAVSRRQPGCHDQRGDRAARAPVRADARASTRWRPPAPAARRC